MLEYLKNLIHLLCRACLNCSSFECKDSLFCENCEKKLWIRHQGIKKIFVETTPVFYLFDWFPDIDPFLNMLLPALKGSAPKLVYQFYAKRLVGLLPRVCRPEGTVVVPCPSKAKRKHALYLAEAIALELGLPILDILQFSQLSGEQKGRNRLERKRTQMQLKDFHTFKHVIFIDDVVTTGSTLKAARGTFKAVKSFEVFCLAHRRSLAVK